MYGIDLDSLQGFSPIVHDYWFYLKVKLADNVVCITYSYKARYNTNTFHIPFGNDYYWSQTKPMGILMNPILVNVNQNTKDVDKFWPFSYD